jgi:hypothetical protein
VSKITFTVSKSKGERPCETECKRNLITVYTTHGIKTARPLFGLSQGTGEPELQCKAKRQRTCKEMPKVARCSTGADEVIVAKIPKRVGVTILRAKDFT